MYLQVAKRVDRRSLYHKKRKNCAGACIVSDVGIVIISQHTQILNYDDVKK